VKRKHSIFIFFLMSMVFVCSNSYPCTTFIYRSGDHLYFGRNLDWVTGTGLIMTNQRNLDKVALMDSSEKPMQWISKYGSVTFNQVGKELPYGGINEAGLVVEQMTLEKTVYPSKDNRCAISACQWIQFQLDNYSTVWEVIKSDELIRIVDATSKFHFLVCDRSGHVAVIEFLNGKMVHYSGQDLSIEALANSTYQESIQCFNNHGDTQADRSLYNFTTAARMIGQPDSSIVAAPVDYAFSILTAVSQGLATKWSIVYDITDMKFCIKVFETPIIVGEQKIFVKQPGVSKTKVVEISDFNFDCTQSSRVLDLEYDYEGLVNEKFVEYNAEINKEYILKAFTFFNDWGIPITLKDEEIDYLAKYPSFKCSEN
jgi:hypothetical protein